MRRWRGAAVTAAVVALVVQPGTASAGGDANSDDAVAPITDEGLQGPRQLSHYLDGRLVVAESDNGQISSVDLQSGTVHTLATFGTPDAPSSPQGVNYGDGHLYVALGETGGGPEAGPPPPVELPPEGTPVPRCTETSTAPAAMALVVVDVDGGVDAVCDLLLYEEVVNPDGQTQVDANNVPVDSLSNPFAVLVQRKRILVADAGANAEEISAAARAR